MTAFFNWNGDSFATVKMNECEDTLPLESERFRTYLAGLYYRSQGKACSAQALLDAISVLDSKARFEGPTVPIYVRMAFVPAEDAIYYDLADSRHVIRVTSRGWQVITNPPIKFIRPKGLHALPVPETGGRVDELRGLLNCSDDRQWATLLAWLMGCFQPEGAAPILNLNGEQGSGKTTTSMMLKILVDPSTSGLQSEPNSIRDLMIAASSGHIFALDNLSNISPFLSDALARLSTGAGFSTRRLRTDGEQHIISCRRPILVNGIPELATRADLADRCLNLTLNTISDDKRCDEADLWKKFQASRARILGALLDAVVAALAGRKTIKVGRLPRMADHAKWVSAAEAALRLSPGTIMDAILGNRTDADAMTIEASPVATALLELMRNRYPFIGTAAELLDLLDSNGDQRRDGWPRSPKALLDEMRRIAPCLCRYGLIMSVLPKTGIKRTMRLAWKGQPDLPATGQETDASQSPTPMSMPPVMPPQVLLPKSSATPKLNPVNGTPLTIESLFPDDQTCRYLTPGLERLRSLAERCAIEMIQQQLEALSMRRPSDQYAALQHNHSLRPGSSSPLKTH
jgi:hypothetical protein